jgi:UDP-N-acetylmuramoylalanine--D-glutamate ligase
VNLQHARALVIGFGRSGRAAASFIKKQGGGVRVVDRSDTPELRAALQADGVEGRLGGYSEADLDGRDLVVVSPGVPWDLPLVEAARGRGIAVTSEMDLFFRFCPAPIAGITGTNGKTTTTALTADVFAAGGLRVIRGGNIGETVLDRLDQVTAASWMVLELSSFQLESVAQPRLRTGAILNVSQNHLDRHHTFERYREIKARAIAFMTAEDTAVLNADDPSYEYFRARTKGRVLPFSTRRTELATGAVVRDGWITVAGTRVLPADRVPLPGEHNLSNVLAAIAMGHAAGVAPDRMRAAVLTFKALEHRLELVGTFNGVRWYNDSKATTPDSTSRALEAFREPIILIAGGRNKGMDLDPLARVIAQRAAALVAMGETGDELVQRVRAHGLARAERADDLKDAVRRAAQAAPRGSVVVLSPAFASYDMFTDFEDRGRRFKAAVRAEVGG